MKELLLIQDVPNVGEQFEIVRVDDNTALDLASSQEAFYLTPKIRLRFSALIKEKYASQA